MTEPAPPTRPRSHRAPVAAGEAAKRLLAPVTAVAVVVVVVLVLIVLNGHPDRGSSPAVVAGPTLTSTHPSSPAAATPATTRPAPASAPTHRASAAPRPTHRARPPHRPAAVTAVSAPVEVLNNSRRTGLAHVVAAQVQAHGWPVYYVGNLRGRILQSTVYYAPGLAVAAQRLAAQFPSVQRVLPNSEGGLATRGVTLVLTRYWSS